MTASNQSIIDTYVDRVFTVAQKQLNSGRFVIQGDEEGDKFIQEVSADLLTYTENHVAKNIIPYYDGDASAYPEDSLVSDVEEVISRKYQEFVPSADATVSMASVSSEVSPSSVPSVSDVEEVGTLQSDTEDVAMGYEDITPEPGLDGALVEESDEDESNSPNDEDFSAPHDTVPMTPPEEYPDDSEIIHRVFTTVNYRAGYDTEDVYEVQQKIMRAMKQVPMSALYSEDESALPQLEDVVITPEMIQEAKEGLVEVNFRRAYDMEEVDQFIDEQVDSLRERIALLNSRYEKIAERDAKRRAERERQHWLHVNREKHTNEIIEVWDKAHTENEVFDVWDDAHATNEVVDAWVDFEFVSVDTTFTKEQLIRAWDDAYATSGNYHRASQIAMDESRRAKEALIRQREDEAYQKAEEENQERLSRMTQEERDAEAERLLREEEETIREWEESKFNAGEATSISETDPDTEVAVDAQADEEVAGAGDVSEELGVSQDSGSEVDSLDVDNFMQMFEILRSEDPKVIAEPVLIGNNVGGMFKVGSVAYEAKANLVTMNPCNPDDESLSLLEVNSAVKYIKNELGEDALPLIVMHSDVGYHPVIFVDVTDKDNGVYFIVQ